MGAGPPRSAFPYTRRARPGPAPPQTKSSCGRDAMSSSRGPPQGPSWNPPSLRPIALRGPGAASRSFRPSSSWHHAPRSLPRPHPHSRPAEVREPRLRPGAGSLRPLPLERHHATERDMDEEGVAPDEGEAGDPRGAVSESSSDPNASRLVAARILLRATGQSSSASVPPNRPRHPLLPQR